ncbi:hypothetical protein KR074_005917 [Drosophila pseudoananassae]|nr:hypothetical protein KR074_005917 [Drosophila pseudoananassae]
MEEELRLFFEECRNQEFSGQEMWAICKPLIWRIRMAKARRWIFIGLPILVSYILWLYCDTFAWYGSALGRIMLIQVLPLWDWTPYYNSKCLIARDAQRVQEELPPLGRHETLWENCALCESLEGVTTTSNMSYSLLESQYLERGLPIILTDAGLETNLYNLLELIEERTPEWLSSEPCDVSTNLLLKKLFNLEATFDKIYSSGNPWHLQLRNCQKKAVKSSRLFLERPYYYPLHLAPYYSSWILAVHQQKRHQAEIYVRGLILFQQLSGHFEVALNPKEPCNQDICPSLRMRLNAGEGLIFSTDLWRLSYGLEKPNPKQSSLASIFEIDWQP